MQRNKYANISVIKKMLYVLSLISYFCLIFMEYDKEFKCTQLLPICYALCVFFLTKNRYTIGLGGVVLIGTYAFRMCLLPVICAYGNFYLEPARSTYIEYYFSAIILMCIECVIVFGSLTFFEKIYFMRQEIQRENSKKGNIVKYAMIIGVFVLFGCYFLEPELFGRYGLIGIDPETEMLEIYGALYYITMLLDILFRPLLAFVLVDFFLSKNTRWGVLLSCFIAILNMLISTDRRVFSLLIGATCLFYILAYGRIKINKKLMYLLIGVGAIFTIVLCFSGENTPLRIARKFQRYFSGPTLTAIGIAVWLKFPQNILTFISKLLNDSIIFTGIYGAIPLTNYVIELCGTAGKSIWTPMTIGSIQYFGIFFPLPLVFAVWFIVYCDYKSNVTEKKLHVLIYDYLVISIGIYMVMYTVELVIHNIIFIGSFYRILLFLDKKYLVKIR